MSAQVTVAEQVDDAPMPPDQPDPAPPTTPGPALRVGLVLGYLLLGGLVVWFLGRLASLPGANIARLELAGTAARAAAARAGVSEAATRTAILWDIAFLVGYAVVLVVGAWYFPRRSYRVRSFRRFGSTAILLTVLAALLDGTENVAMWVGLSSAGDGPWLLAATVSWAKWLILIVVVIYVLVAVGTFAVTPAWVQHYLRNPPPPNVILTPEEALEPERHVEAGTPGLAPPDLLEHARFGIAASGGGIRSASLVLGSLQALDEAYPDAISAGPSWATADKIASVSGGSYISGGFSVARSRRRAGSPAPPAEPTAWRPNSPEETHLLSRLGYLLAPNPSGQVGADAEDRARTGSDVPGLVAMIVVGMALNAAVLFSLLWMLVQPYGWLLKSPVVECRTPTDCHIQPFLVQPVLRWALVAAVVLVIWVGAGWVRAAYQPSSRGFRFFRFLNHNLRPVLMGLLLMTAVLALLLIVGPALVTAVPGWLAAGQKLLTPAAVVSAIGSLVALGRGLTGRNARFAPYVAGGLFVVLVVLICVQWLISAHFDARALGIYAALLGGWALLYSFVSGEWWSIAAFYRARLRLAFATYRKTEPNGDVVAEPLGSGNGPPETVEPSIYELVERRSGVADGSPLNVCATAHASTREVRTHYGLPAMSVTISPETVRVHVPTDDEGGWQAYQASTGLVESLMFRRTGPRLTTMLAVGVSGAAISPAMGQYRIGPAKALLAVANVRLGVWMPNPRYAAHYQHTPSGVRPTGPLSGVKYPRPRLGYLLKELFGVHDPNDLYIYVTDAGHWENTGLVELIRDRNIDEVVCFDADEKPRETATEIAAAIGLAKLECNADVLLDLDVLRGPYDGHRGTDYSPQSVALGLIERGDHLGLLWYAKPVLTQNTPLELLSYAECDASFPTTSTVDQFFHTAQFKAYRDLGRHNGAEIVAAREALRTAFAGSPTYRAFTQAAQLDPPHWAVTSLIRLRLSEDQYAGLRKLFGRPSTFVAKSAQSAVDGAANDSADDSAPG